MSLVWIWSSCNWICWFLNSQIEWVSCTRHWQRWWAPCLGDLEQLLLSQKFACVASQSANRQPRLRPKNPMRSCSWAALWQEFLADVAKATQWVISGWVLDWISHVWSSSKSWFHFEVQSMLEHWRRMWVWFHQLNDTMGSGDSQCFQWAIVFLMADCPEANFVSHMQYIGGLDWRADPKSDQSTLTAARGKSWPFWI